MTNLRLPGQYDERLLASLGLQGPYYNWNRWYLPGVGRYLEPDPLATPDALDPLGEAFPPAPEWYTYSGGNPLRYFDSDGLSKTSGIPGDDIAYRELREAMKCGRPAVEKVAAKYIQMHEAGQLNPQRWKKIKGWIKLAKDGRLPGFFLGICWSTLDCKCVRDPDECKHLLDDLEGK